MSASSLGSRQERGAESWQPNPCSRYDTGFYASLVCILAIALGVAWQPPHIATCTTTTKNTTSLANSSNPPEVKSFAREHADAVAKSSVHRYCDRHARRGPCPQAPADILILFATLRIESLSREHQRDRFLESLPAINT